MTKTVYKYVLPLRNIHDHSVINMPQGAEIVKVGVQYEGGEPTFWALVDTDAPSENRRIIARGTGQPFYGNEGKYLGTTLHDRGTLVLHFFEHN